MTTESRVAFDDAADSQPRIAIGRQGWADGQRRVLYMTDAATALGPAAFEEQVGVLDSEQWLAVLDRAAQRALKMSGDEFVRRWDAGEFGDPDDSPEVMRVGMLLPSGR